MDIMDVANLSTSMAQSTTMNQVGTSVLSMTLDHSKEDGAALTKMMETSVNPNLGQNFDAYA
jgi:hypothetical protein